MFHLDMLEELSIKVVTIFISSKLFAYIALMNPAIENKKAVRKRQQNN